MRIIVLRLTDGSEVIGAWMNDTGKWPTDGVFAMEYPQVVEYWRLENKMLAFDFFPYSYTGDESIVEIHAKHVVSAVPPDEEGKNMYLQHINEMHELLERESLFKRESEEQSRRQSVRTSKGYRPWRDRV